MSEKNTQKVITRFPPSPTGPLHLGSARTALFNYLFAKKNGGEMILRFEDTDKERSKKEYEKKISEALLWLGLEGHGPFRQSERSDIYERHIEKLLKEKKVFVSKEEKEEGSEKLPEVIRFINPGGIVSFDDEVRGKVEFDVSELGDFVIAKNVREPLYHLAVVIDDFEMGVTHVIRGEDHVSNTARQILIQKALGAPRPLYAHIPLILAPDRSKLSKRAGAVSVLEFKEKGFLPEALLNYLALLGWNPGGDKEIYSIPEIIEKFDIKDIQKSGAIFDTEKLLWFNRHYLRELPEDVFWTEVKEWLPKEILNLSQYSDDRLIKMTPLLKEKIGTFSEVRDMAENGDLEYYFEKPGYFAENLKWKEDDIETAQKHLEHVLELLKQIKDKDFTQDEIKEAVWPYAEKEGRGSVLWPMRYALSGVDKSPDPFALAEILGKEEASKRIEDAIDSIKNTQ